MLSRQRSRYEKNCSVIELISRCRFFKPNRNLVLRPSYIEVLPLLDLDPWSQVGPQMMIWEFFAPFLPFVHLSLYLFSAVDFFCVSAVSKIRVVLILQISSMFNLCMQLGKNIFLSVCKIPFNAGLSENFVGKTCSRMIFLLEGWHIKLEDNNPVKQRLLTDI